MKISYKFAGVMGVGLILLFILVNFSLEPQNTFVTITKTDGTFLEISAEIADSPEEWSMGLMHRETLGENSGMIFIFNDETYRNFWMKNTLIPLDIIYINGEGVIVDVVYAVPCEADPCPLYPSSAPAKYVLEVNGGFAEERGIGIGDTISILS